MILDIDGSGPNANSCTDWIHVECKQPHVSHRSVEQIPEHQIFNRNILFVFTLANSVFPAWLINRTVAPHVIFHTKEIDLGRQNERLTITTKGQNRWLLPPHAAFYC